MALSTVMVELKASISDLQAKFGAVKTELDGLSKKASTTGDKMAAVGKGLTLGLGAGAIAVGVAAVGLAEKFDAAHASMETAFKAAGVSAAQVKGPISAVDKAMEKLGYTNAETEGAVSKLVIAHVPLNQIMKDTTLAADIAAQRHIDLSSAMTIVTKASEGNVGALKRMGIDLPVVAGGAAKVASAQAGLATAQDKVNAILAKSPDAMKSGSKAHAAYEAAVGKVTVAHKKLADAQASGGTLIDQLSGRFSGQAAAAADTFNGKMKVLKVEAEDYGVKLGNFLIPKIEGLMHATEDVVQWFQKHKGAAEALGIAVGGLGAVFIGAYGIQSVMKFGKAIGDSVTAVGKSITAIGNLASKIPGLGSAAQTSSARWITASEEAAAAQERAAAQTEAAATRIKTSFTGIGTSAETSAGEVEGSAAAAGGAMDTETSAASRLAASFYGVAAGLGALAGAYGIMKSASDMANGKTADQHILPWNPLTRAADDIKSLLPSFGPKYGADGYALGTPLSKYNADGTPKSSAPGNQPYSTGAGITSIADSIATTLGPNGMPIPPSTSSNAVPAGAAANAVAAMLAPFRLSTTPHSTGAGITSIADSIATSGIVVTKMPPTNTKAHGNVTLVVH
jgi:hypothetical protein